MRTSFLLLLSGSSILLMGCGDEPPLGTSKKRCPSLNRTNLEGEIVADSCFQLERDAFAFENYPDGANLRVEEMIEVFGDGVCRSDGAKCSTSMEVQGQCRESCVLTDKAMKHMLRYNQWIEEGHCDGMAALSQRFFSAGDMGPTIERGFDEPLQREIARWWATQLTVQQRGAGVYEDKEPSEVAAYLDYLWTNKSNATLWIYYLNDGRTAAHALTPYAVTNPSNGVQYIYVYDSNAPTAVKHVELHPATGEWSYEDSGNKAGTAMGASPAGLAKLRFVSNEARLGRYCWFCDHSFANAQQNLLTLGRDAPARIFNKGKELARQSEQGVWSVEDGVELHFPLANLDDHPLPSLVFEPTETYQIEFTASVADEQGEFLVSLPGNTTFGVNRIEPPHGKMGVIGTATVNPQVDKPQVQYESVDAENVTLHWSTQRQAADQSMDDYEVRVTMKGPGAGVASMQDDALTGEFAIGFEAKTPEFTAYELRIEIAHRALDGFVKTNEFVRVPDAPKVTYKLKTNAMNDNVDVAVDIGSDGTVDMTETWMPTSLDLTMGTYMLNTEFLGEYACLEGNDPASAIESGNAFMNGCVGATGQRWQFVPIAGTPYYQMHTQLLGATKCLDGDSSAFPMHVGAAFMNDCNTNAPGQNWSVEKGALGGFILQAPLLDPGLCFEGNQPDSPVHDGGAFLDVCRHVSGQQWVLTQVP